MVLSFKGIGCGTADYPDSIINQVEGISRSHKATGIDDVPSGGIVVDTDGAGFAQLADVTILEPRAPGIDATGSNGDTDISADMAILDHATVEVG